MKHRDWLKQEYKRLKNEAAPVQECAGCGSKGAKSSMDPHHPHGRAGDNLLRFCWIHRHCHTFIHDNPSKGKAMGLMEFDGSIEKKHHQYDNQNQDHQAHQG
jgi:hypothetical protein